MTERRAALAALTASVIVCALGFTAPTYFQIQFLHTGEMLIFIATFAAIRGARRPFGLPVRAAAGLLAALPAARGGIHLHHLWMGIVWFGFLEFFCAAVKRRWIVDVRHRYAVTRLKRSASEDRAQFEKMKQGVDNLQDEVTLYQTVYDLATRQSVGMARADILTASSDSLKELARRRQFHFRSMYLFLMSGEDIDLRSPRHAATLNDRARAVKDKIQKMFQPQSAPDRASEVVTADDGWVGVAIRYQNSLLGGLCLEIDGLPGGRKLSPTDLKLLTITADLMGLALENSILYEQVNQMAITDRLTGLYVLWYFKERLREEVHRAVRSHKPIAVMMMDLDHFKKVNDTYGHLAGDAVLREVSGRIKSALREGDFIARYGGEEIACLLPDTDGAGALRVAERIRTSLERHEVDVQSAMLRVTISIGVNEVPVTADHDPDPSLTASRLLKGADEALYRAKRDGRNCVRSFQPAAALRAAPENVGKE